MNSLLQEMLKKLVNSDGFLGAAYLRVSKLANETRKIPVIPAGMTKTGLAGNTHTLGSGFDISNRFN